jgi:hypothetical protein
MGGVSIMADIFQTMLYVESSMPTWQEKKGVAVDATKDQREGVVFAFPRK